MCQQHSHILQGQNQIASQSPTPPSPSESHAICQPMDLGSSRSWRTKLVQLCPEVMSRRVHMPVYQERTCHLPITTPSKIKSFIITQLFNRSKTSYSYGKKQPAPWPVPPSCAPQKGCESVTVSRATFCIPAAQRDSANLCHLFCFPRFGLRRCSPR